MKYIGELISLGVACSWTIAAISSEIGSRHLGVFVMNVWRMALALLFSAFLMWIAFDCPYPLYASGTAWCWLLMSGVVGYFFGDWCLFNCYLTIGSRYGQLFMTLAPMFTAIMAWVMLGQELSWRTLLAMAVTLSGIAISVLSRNGNHHVVVSLPTKGILFGIGAGLGQGVGLVLSKVGLDYYSSDVPASILPDVESYLPFGSNMIRCVAGLACFSIWLLFRGEASRLAGSIHDWRGLTAMLVAVFSGPFVGVGFSLMALQYTAAGIASTLMALTPIIILLPSRWIFKQPITLRNVMGAVISCIGVSLFFLL
ncbi:MAG: DMT family transporter [Prevotella sp.]|nr:DMT family transporter [Prevotella sp.]